MITTIPPQPPEISMVDALWVLVQSQIKAVRKALTKRLLAEQDKTTVQKTLVKDSLKRAFDELEKNPFSGESLGKHTYKNRMAIAS